ncbi:MAG: hypothetical protein OCC49_04730 [Fibrobacterales bacterium]
MIRSILISIILCGVLTFSKSLPPSLAIYTPVEHNTTLLELDILHKSLHMAFAQSGYFSVLSIDETENRLKILGEESSTKCLSSLCFYLTGRKLAIDLALGSYFSKKDGVYYLEVSLYDIHSLENIATASKSIKAFHKEDIVTLSKAVAEELTGFHTPLTGKNKPSDFDSKHSSYTSWGVALASLTAVASYILYDNHLFDSKDENTTELSTPLTPNNRGLSGLRGFYASAPSGARYKAMGSIGVSMVNDGFAPLINPAGLVHLTHTSVTLSHATLPGNVSQLYMSYSSMLIRNLFHSQAITVEGDDLVKEFQFLSSYATDLSLYSKYLTAVRAGITFKGYFVTTGNDGVGIEKSTGRGLGYGIDLGIQWSLLNNFHFGAQLKDLHSAIYYTNTLTDSEYSEDLPPLFTLGGHFESDYALNLGLSIQKGLYADQKDHLSLGLEKQILGILWLRSGMTQILDQEGFRKWGLGFGLQHKQGRFTVKIDYSYDYGYENSEIFNKKQNVTMAILF